MDEETRAAQRDRWEREYAQLLSNAGDEPAVRVKTHIQYLDEYFLRWLGFCRLEFTAPQELTDNGLFFVVEAASKVAARDVNALSSPGLEHVREAWRDYQQSLTSLRNHMHKLKAEAENCYLRLQAFSEAFQNESGC